MSSEFEPRIHWGIDYFDLFKHAELSSMFLG